MKTQELSKYEVSQLKKIIHYYTWLDFKLDLSMTCPAWGIFENGKKLGTIFFFGAWRIESPPDQWGEDFEQFVCDIEDFEE